MSGTICDFVLLCALLFTFIFMLRCVYASLKEFHANCLASRPMVVSHFCEAEFLHVTMVSRTGITTICKRNLINVKKVG